MVGADEAQIQTLSLILSFKHPETIENLFIDIHLIQLFIPEKMLFEASFAQGVIQIMGSIDLI